jgi:lipoprotein-anchoring transpeptidase ErfK/SrfK
MFLIVVIFVLLCIKVVDFDTFPLALKMNGNSEVTIKLNEEYKDEGVSAKLFWSDKTSKVKKEDNVNNTIPGKYYVKYSYQNILFRKSVTRIVNVIDDIAPVLTLDKNKITIYENGVIYPGKIKAKDNFDGNISDKVEVEKLDTSKPGKYKVKVSVKDSSGNETTDNINVTIKKKVVKNGSNKNRVDVYISEQKLYYYENNKLILTSDVVTGKKDKTPRGNYKVLRKKKDIYLKGDTFLDHVDYWVAFIGGLYGIHDASWRSEFGGDIFQSDGSHGCVNMPTDNMKKLYNRIEIGTAVNIYD